MKGNCRLKLFPTLPTQRLELRWIILLVIILLFIILLWPNPASSAYWDQAASPTAASGNTVPSVPTATLTVAGPSLPTPTPIPSEYLENTDQTSGIICGSVVMVLIIVGGTLGVLRRRNGFPHK